MEKKYKQIFAGAAGCIVLYVALSNISVVWGAFKQILSIILPIVVGLVIAFIFNVPMKGIENIIEKIFGKAKYKPQGNALHIISLIITILLLTLVIALVWTSVIPQVMISVKNLFDNIMKQMPVLMEKLSDYDIDLEAFYDVIKNFNFESIVTSMKNGIGSVIGYLIQFATSAVSVISFTLIAIVVAVYVLLSKDKLYMSCKKLCYAYLRKDIADKIYYVSSLLNKTYTKFLSGQCMEALIIGVLMFAMLKIFKLPYAELTGMLAAVFSFVPYIGAFLSCFVGAALMLLSGSDRVVTYVIVYVVTQFVENQFIYPHVVGNSVGLPPIWILFAVVIGGELFGVIGMIFFIPFVAVLYTLLKNDVTRRLNKKDVKIDK